jgi:hypothetical protein
MSTALLSASIVRRYWTGLLALLLLLSLRAPAQTSGNPILPGYQADPEMSYLNGKYYIYPTTDANSSGGQFHAFSSTDLTNWTDLGTIFDLGRQTTWATYNGWAPSVVARNGKYYFYFTARYNAANTPAIGVAVGNSPTGPFTDKGQPLLTPALSNNLTQDVIDPMVFVDDDGQAYIYYGGSNGSRLVVRKLNADMVSLTADAPRDITPQNFTEGPYLVKRNGLYYMSYSNGSWTNDSYNVQYATSTTPTGPWTYRGSLLSSDAQNFGPGHHSITKISGCDDYYIVYHRYPDRSYSTRKVAIDHLTFNYDGTIQKVNMTNYGVAPRTASGPCPVSATFASGATYKLVHKGTNQALDVAGGGGTPGANVQQYTDNGNDAQRWVISLQADGYYKVLHKGTNQVLDVAGGSAAPNTNVQQYTDGGSDAQRWRLEAADGGFYKLTHKGTNQCLDVAGNSGAAGANVAQYTDNGNDAQRWQFTLAELPIVSGGVYRLTHKGTTQCLEVPGNTAAAGQALAQYTDNGNDAQRWVITLMPDGYYKLTHRNTNQCLEVAGNSTTAGAVVQQYTDNGNDAQRWQIVSTGDGYVKLVHKGTSQCLDVDNNLSNPGTAVHQYTDNGNDAQRWRLDLMPQAPSGARTLATGGAAATDAAPLLVYPSPATGHVHFVVTPTQTGSVALDVYDVQGRLVRHLAAGPGTAGVAAEYTLDGSTWAAGIYTVRLTTAGQTTHGKLVLVH